MKRCYVLLLVLLSTMFLSVANVQPVRTVGVVYIRADGSVDPPASNIVSTDNVTYTFIGNIDAPVFVERNNTIVDGAGFALTAGGILLYYVSNVTIKNLKITEYDLGGIALRYSSNNLITGNNMTGNRYGIELDFSGNNRVVGNNIASNRDYGIFLGGSSGSNNISANTVVGNYRGIYLGSSRNDISGNTIVGNSQYGILIDAGHDSNSISGNTITANGEGVEIDTSSNNSVSGNFITDNAYGISLLSASYNGVFENTISANSGYGIFLSASSNNSIHENEITDNTFGISLGGSSDNSISGNIVTANKRCGITLTGWSSSNSISGNAIIANNPDGDPFSLGGIGGIEIMGPSNSISKNTIAENNDYGIWLNGLAASNNSVLENNISANRKYGVFLSGSSNYNRLFGNSIVNSEFGVSFSACSNNVFYHNTLVNNTKQGYAENSVNVWDNGYPSGGNLWSDYTGTDSNGDGIGDTPYVVDQSNQDRYPLVAPAVWNYSTSVPVVLNGTVSWVSLSSNSTISTFKFDQTREELRFNVTGASGTKGYCNVTIPKQLMWAENGQWQVLVSGVAVTPTVTDDDANTYLYFIYSHSTRMVEIRGTSAGEPSQQPEPFPIVWIIAAIAVPALAAATGYLFLKRKK